MNRIKKCKSIFGIAISLFLCSVTMTTSFAASSAPTLTSSDVDLVPYMNYQTYGKQEDSENGKRQEITKSSSGVTVKFKSQAVDYGIRFNTDYIKEDGTLYYSFTLDPQNDLWNGGTNHIYGGPKIQLAKVATGEDMFTNFLTVQFTQGDGIDFRVSDKAGGDVMYLGGLMGALKAQYPDTKSSNKGNKGYDVIIKLSKIGVSMWMSGTQVIEDVRWDSLYDRNGAKIPFEFQSFAPGICTAASRTTVHNFRLWCSKEDATVKVTSNNTNNSSISSTNGSKQSANNDSSSSKDFSSGTESDTSADDSADIKEDGEEVILKPQEGSSTFVKAEKVKIPAIMPIAIIIAISVLFIGAVAIVLFYTVFKNKF